MDGRSCRMARLKSGGRGVTPPHKGRSLRIQESMMLTYGHTRRILPRAAALLFNRPRHPEFGVQIGSIYVDSLPTGGHLPIQIARYVADKVISYQFSVIRQLITDN